ncbi:hypothetical protein ACFLZG_04570, partial [Thermodesulfobacteriota bacterium]
SIINYPNDGEGFSQSRKCRLLAISLTWSLNEFIDDYKCNTKIFPSLQNVALIAEIASNITPPVWSLERCPQEITRCYSASLYVPPS